MTVQALFLAVSCGKHSIMYRFMRALPGGVSDCSARKYSIRYMFIPIDELVIDPSVYK